MGGFKKKGKKKVRCGLVFSFSTWGCLARVLGLALVLVFALVLGFVLVFGVGGGVVCGVGAGDGVGMRYWRLCRACPPLFYI